MKIKCYIKILLLVFTVSTLNAQFVHPGLSHKLSDLDRMKHQVEAKIEPWYSSYQDMCAKNTASYDYVVQGNTSLHEVYRDAPRTNKNIFEADSRAAYYNALRWYIEGDTRFAEKAIECMNAWTGLTYVQHNGTTALSSNMIIIMLEAAELIKNTYSGWSESEIQAFKDMLVYPGYSDTTIPPNESTEGTWYWRAYKFDPVRAGNQELCAIRTTMALGIFLDNEKMYDRAKRYITKFPGRIDDIPFPTGPHVRGSEIDRNEYRISYNITVGTTERDFYGNGALTNYVYENGQCQESSRDQGHTSFGLGLLCSIGEISWNQGYDLWGNTDSRILLGLEYSLKYNVSFVQSYPDQTTPWEPTVSSGEFVQRDDATLRTHGLAICPFIDTDVTRLTRGTFYWEDTWELPIAHYVGRGLKTPDDLKWTIRARDYSIEENGRYETGPTGGAYVGYGGLSFRRPDGCFGDPISGFDSNGLPEYKMNDLSVPIEAENFDYFVLDGQDRTYSDNSSTNEGGAYRTDESVDVKVASEGGYCVTNIEAGEYLTYTINVPANGTYNLGIRYASANVNGNIKFNLDGEDVTEDVPVPHGGSNSTGLTDWKDFQVASEVHLTKGVKALKLMFSGASSAFELNNFSISLVEADPDPVNLAVLHGVASQSIDSDPCPYGGCAENAIDGNTNGNFGGGSVSHSAHGTSGSLKWWKVDLQNNYNIETINIYNRTGGYQSRLSDLTVEIKDSNGNTVYSEFFAGYPDPSWFLNIGGIVGQEVIISKTTDTGITLAEVEVFGVDKAVTLSQTDFEFKNVVKVYPNPVINQLNITNAQDSKITIYNILGKQVLPTFLINQYHQQIDLNQLKAGVYFLKIVGLNGSITKRIIKK
ncbi:alginate lyase family protein [Tamlana sp. 62-3]|uniref:Alginate lyase family protein n=1 Tax=Neotamlana sargassicola TaxID=2883125 RepID=A0A9X1I5R7_9FLAO|nr:carbohydrate-binding protein [Tamlana sargassicola]MCB4807953.1 alginate lyase family protein [Tamlana sargassicola]